MVFKGLGCGASGVGFYGFQGFRVWGLGCRVLWFSRVQGVGLRV